MDTPILDKENCQQVLQKFLQTTNFQLTSFEVVNFHNPFQGLVGEHFTLRIKYQHENKSQSEDFFVKTLSSNPFMLDFSKILQVYEKEAFFYQLLSEYDKYNIDTSFAPKGLFFKPYVIVLEDLSKGHKGTPKRTLLDLEHCFSCLETLARFHASGLIYEKKKEKELGKKFSLNDANKEILEDKLSSNKEENIATKWMRCSVEGLFDLIDLIPENHITHDVFKKKLSELLSDESVDDGLISGVLHGDAWTSNFLHCYKNGKPVDTKLLDFQLLKYGPLEQDVAEFLMTNTTPARNFQSLVEHYYSKLTELLIGGGLDGEVLPSNGEFLRSCENFKLPGKIHAAVDHSFTFMGDEIFEDALESEESFKKMLFEERGKCNIECYNKNEEFRKVLCEDLLELRDLLFS